MASTVSATPSPYATTIATTIGPVASKSKPTTSPTVAAVDVAVILIVRTCCTGVESRQAAEITSAAETKSDVLTLPLTPAPRGSPPIRVRADPEPRRWEFDPCTAIRGPLTRGRHKDHPRRVTDPEKGRRVAG